MPTRYGVRTREPEELAAHADGGVRLSVLRASSTKQSLKAFSLSVFERTFSVTGALSVLTLTIAAFAILMSLLTLAAMRLPQMAPVWAMGTTQRRLAGLEILRTVLLAAITAVLALPLGLALAWVLLAIVNVEAFGWRLPMYLFPSRLYSPDDLRARRRAAGRALAGVAARANAARRTFEDLRQ